MTESKSLKLLADVKNEVAAFKSFVNSKPMIDLEKPLRERKPIETIFELWGNLRAINSLSPGLVLRVENLKTGSLALPMAPADKANYPYLVASNLDADDLFQICLGTNITGPDGETYAPDLSVQSPSATLSPGGGDIAFAWDFKHKAQHDQSLDRDEVINFYGKMQFIEASATLTLLPFPEAGTWPNKDAVLTNAQATTLSDARLAKFEIVEISKLWPEAGATRRP